MYDLSSGIYRSMQYTDPRPLGSILWRTLTHPHLNCCSNISNRSCNLTCSTPQETAARLFAESTWLQGALLSNIVYGVELALFGICFKLLVQHTNRQNYRRQLFFLSFVTLVFILGTVFVYSNSEFTQLAFVDDRDSPGGPAMFGDKMLDPSRRAR